MHREKTLNGGLVVSGEKKEDGRVSIRTWKGEVL